VIIGFSLLVYPTFGQYRPAQKFNSMEVGIEGGLNIPFFTKYDSYEDVIQSNNSYVAGLTYQYNFKNRFSLRTSISFEKRRFYTGNYQYSNEDMIIQVENVQTYWNRTYISMPLLGRVNFGKKAKFFINAGPHFGMMFENEKQLDEIILEGRGSDLPRNLEFSLDHQFKRFDVGISTGVGASVDIISRFVFSLEIRNNTGFYNISKIEDTIVKNNSVNVLFGGAYKISKHRRRINLGKWR
jgi:hypothetical protein